jgi:cysteine-S-conjugate beta-lyase
MTQALPTQFVHHPYRPPDGFEAIVPAVHKASTVLFRDVAALRARSKIGREGYSYGLLGTPTSYRLEQQLCTLEGARHCVLGPSGLAAITVTNVGLLRQGDEVLLPANVYGPSLIQARGPLARMGISHQLYDPTRVDDLKSRLSARTRLVWVEAPGSVTMEFPDLRGLVQAARAAGATVALDNTWGAGIAFSPFEMGVDISVHALTKYPSGGGDVLMGATLTRDDTLHEKIHGAHTDLGIGVAANDVEFVLRSLPSMALRYAAHDAAARDLARWLAAQPQVRQVLHPALPGSPGHEHWATHCSAAAGLFSVMFHARYTQQQVDAFCDRLRLFGIGYSWGGPMSLAVPYDLDGMRAGPFAGTLRHEGHLVRFSIGLEGVEDLRADLAQALQSAFG